MLKRQTIEINKRMRRAIVYRGLRVQKVIVVIESKDTRPGLYKIDTVEY